MVYALPDPPDLPALDYLTLPHRPPTQKSSKGRVFVPEGFHLLHHLAILAWHLPTGWRWMILMLKVDDSDGFDVGSTVPRFVNLSSLTATTMWIVNYFHYLWYLYIYIYIARSEFLLGERFTPQKQFKMSSPLEPPVPHDSLGTSLVSASSASLTEKLPGGTSSLRDGPPMCMYILFVCTYLFHV